MCFFCYIFFFFVFFLPFFSPSGRFPSLPRDFTVYTIYSACPQSFCHCERCRIRTRDHCLRTVVWSATNEPPHLSNSCSPLLSYFLLILPLSLSFSLIFSFILIFIIIFSLQFFHLVISLFFPLSFFVFQNFSQLIFSISFSLFLTRSLSLFQSFIIFSNCPNLSIIKFHLSFSCYFPHFLYISLILSLSFSISI